MTLAELAVKLTANTAEFISGFSNAGIATKRFRADLSDHVQAIGGALDGVLSHFGQFGGVVGQTLDGATQAASRAITTFGKLGGTAGTIAGVGAGAAAALFAIEGGAIALAIHSAETAARLGEMSEKAGLSSRSLAGLALAGRGVGVETESLVKALGFMGSNAVKSAISADYAHTAFGRLGISVKDASGNLKDGGQLFLEVVGKIANLPTSEQGYFVKQIFGRGGLEILPLINKGVDGIREKMEEAQSFGLGDPQAVAAARQFKETLDDVHAGFEGAALKLAKDLLPTLQIVADRMKDAFDSGRMQTFIDHLATIVSKTVELANSFVGFSQFLSKNFLEFNPSKIAESWEQFRKDVKTFDLGAEGKAPKDLTAVGFKFLSTLKPAVSGADISPTADTSLVRIKARIEALSSEAVNWAKVASAGTQAEQLIFEAAKKSDEEFGKLKAEAAKSPAATALVIKDEGLIKAAAQQAIYGQAIKALVSDLDKQQEKFNEEGNAATRLAAAFQQGGAAIASAELDKKFADQTSRLNVLKEAHDLLIPKLGAESPVVKELATAYDALSAKLQLTKDAASKVLSESLTAELIKQGAIIAGTKPYVDALNSSYSQGETAVRKARIELELYQFEQDQLTKGIVLTTAQKEKERAILEESDRQAYQGALAQEAAQFSLNAQYDSQITKLQRVREILQQNGQSTLLIDARLHDAQDGLLHQWDEAAFKVGTFSQKFKGVMGELVIQGRAAGQAISQAFLGAIDGIETNLAKLLTGQKTNFKQVAQNLAEQVTKAEIQQGVGKIAEHIPGLSKFLDSQKPLGSTASNPMFVAVVNSLPGQTDLGKFPSLGGGGLGSPDSGGGGFFSSFLSSFGGGRAGGGDMSPGSWYVAGERGPEIVTGPGSVIPNHALGGRTTNITHNHNYPNATSRDLFGRTQQQNQARQVRNSRMAYGS